MRGIAAAPRWRLERIGGRLLHDAERYRGLAVEADDAALVQRPELGMADVGKADG